MRRKTFILAVLFFLVPATLHATIIKGPYLQGPDTTAMTVMWETDTASPSEVRYGPTPSLGGSAEGMPGIMHKVRLTGLKPGSVYYYRTMSNNDESATYQFKTFPATAGSFRFVVFGDSRDNPAEVERISGLVGALNPRPAFAVHTGDIVSDGRRYTNWGSEFFTPEHHMMADIPVYFVLGNHEHDSNWYHSFFDLPGNGRWYDFEYGDAVFIVLDTNTSTKPGSEQYIWLEDTLKRYAGKEWKFVFFHHPVYSTGGHGSDLAKRADLQPIIERYNVNMVFSGHDHDYERFEVDGVTYIVTGGLGAPLYPRMHNGQGSRIFAAIHHFCVVDVSGRRLTMKVLNDKDGKVENFRLNNNIPPR